MDNLEASIGRYIGIIFRRAQVFMANELKPYNIGSGQYVFLLVLNRKDGMTQEQLSHELALDKGTTARALDKLEASGYVIRKRSTEDGRAYNVFLTEAGREIQPVLQRTLNRWRESVLVDISREDRQTLGKILQKMAANTVGNEETNE